MRIVKLTLAEKHLNDFLNHFDTVKHKINAFEGCYGVELLVDKKNKGVVFTYSKWVNEEALDHYRSSELFQVVWQTVKQWFSDKPQAWSSDSYFNGFEN